ncbi:hypothetical protein PDESU_00272 [Pontiella desulfatans]|uniref:PEP-CTERM protein-sorting domain-containing protein n=1 Tax=Pontiella desulfatans TaxID=2750659 RepID=A0A6C2TWN1_PONDE|nr:hypothetical protein [Pontiella desulfatans]VGO11726.1 hypothetical protein PDESU_00272 [Pontiella desulfatans]
MKKILTCAALVALPLALMAQTTITWTGAGDGSTYTDGVNWGGTAPTDDLTTDIAQLTGGTVNLDADRSVYGLDIDTASTLTGSGTRLILGGGGLTGSSALILSNNVTLRTGTVTTYASDVTIDGATVEATTGTQGFLGTGTITLDNGGTIAGQSSHINMRDTTSIVLGSGGGTLANAHTRAVYGLNNTVISGAGQLTLDGSGSTSYSGNSRIQMEGGINTYTGGTRLQNKANVQVTADENFGAAGSKVTIDDARLITGGGVDFGSREFAITSNGGRISLNNQASTIGGSLSGSGALLIDGQNLKDNGGTPSGTLTLTADSTATFTGDITIGPGATLKANQNSIAIDSGLGTANITLDGGTLSANGNNHMDIGNRQIVLTENGGTVIHGGSRNIYGSTKITGAGQLTIKGANGDGGRFQMTGNGSDYTGGTLVTEGGQAWAYYGDSFGTGAVTLDNGDLQLVNNGHTFANDIAVVGTGSDIKGAKTATFSGVLSGTGELTIKDNGTLSFSNTGNTFEGTLNLGTSAGTVNLTSLGDGATITGDGAGTLNFLGAISLDTANTYAGGITVASGGSIGGSGSLAGDLTLASGAMIEFSATETLTVAGSVTLDSSFGIDDLLGLDGSTAEGTYTLIANDGDFSHIENFGEAFAADIGGGKSAYFQTGSLQVVVIPEPATLGLVAVFGAAVLFIRRRFMI